PPLPEEVTTEWEGRTFALVDLAVAEPHRGRGIGRGLIETLLSSRGESRAVLTVQPTAQRTQAIYRHLGWKRMGRKGPFDGALSRYWDLYAIDLAPDGGDRRT
ncbi:GNAT family N-acetyltransferase, partial [Glycomyces tenuis]